MKQQLMVMMMSAEAEVFEAMREYTTVTDFQSRKTNEIEGTAAAATRGKKRGRGRRNTPKPSSNTSHSLGERMNEKDHRRQIIIPGPPPYFLPHYSDP